MKVALCVALVASCAAVALAKAAGSLGENVALDDEISAVVISAGKEDTSTAGSRQPRQFSFKYPARLGPVFPRLPFNQPCKTSQGLDGVCMTLNKCYPRRKIFRLPAHETWAMGLYNTCGVESSRGVQVYGTCCPNNKTEAEAVGDSSMQRSKNQKAKTPCLLTQDQIDGVKASQCTRNNQAQSQVQSFTKIVGGTVAQKNEYRFIAALLATDRTGRERQFCGGSLIDEYHILTAAHCVIGYTENDISMLRVRLGAHKLSLSRESSVHHVDRIIRHIKFNTHTLDFDVAVLTLREKAPIGDKVKAICLPSVDLDYQNFEAIVAGWGALRPQGFEQPDELQKVKVKVWSNDECHESYGKDAPGGITKNMMCANLPGQDSCQGDSGGPLFTCDRNWRANGCSIIGIVSWGISCAEKNYPGVYSRVTELKNWVDRITRCY